jgi:hypothetical protein
MAGKVNINKISTDHSFEFRIVLRSLSLMQSLHVFLFLVENNTSFNTITTAVDFQT